MRKIPGHSLFDSSLALMREGCHFISNRCQHYQSPVFASRLLLQRTLCMRGEAAAKLFYDPQLLTRKQALPWLSQNARFDRDVMQGMHGTGLLQCKPILRQMLAAHRVEWLVQLAEQQWLAAMQRWEGQPRVVMLPAIETLLCKAVCRWAGLPLADTEARFRWQQMLAMNDGCGGLGPRRQASLRACRAAEDWAATLIWAQRSGHLGSPQESAIAVFSMYRDDSGKLLDEHTAAVELLNLLRPTVAAARLIVCAVLELHRHPEWQLCLACSDEWLRPFSQEVRRLYSFTPYVAARMRQDFEWDGYPLQAGTRVLLDLHGTTRDPVTWQLPGEFMPERFIDWKGSRYTLIPQGDTDAQDHQRCPSEDLTSALIESALRLFTRSMRYTLVDQDISIASRGAPLLSASRLVLTEIAAGRGWE